jgi:hypothetical protein
MKVKMPTILALGIENYVAGSAIVGELAPTPAFNLLPHRLEVALHPSCRARCRWRRRGRNVLNVWRARGCRRLRRCFLLTGSLTTPLPVSIGWLFPGYPPPDLFLLGFDFNCKCLGQPHLPRPENPQRIVVLHVRLGADDSLGPGKETCDGIPRQVYSVRLWGTKTEIASGAICFVTLSLVCVHR